jgi:PAS domain S-box-containing protein
LPERKSIVPRLKRKLAEVPLGVRQLDMNEALRFFSDLNFPDKSLLKENFYSVSIAKDFVVFLITLSKLHEIYALFNPLAEAREVLEAELRRREAERLFEKVFKKALHGMMIVERLKIKEVNEAFKTMLMYDGDDLIGKNPIDLLAEDERETAKEVYERRKSAGVPVPPREVKFLRKDGGTVVAVLDGVMIDREKEIFVFFVRDVTEEKKQRSRIKELEDTIARATRLNLLGEVASMLFHEIGNPLTSLIISLEIFKKEIDSLEGDLKKKFLALWKIMHDKVAYIRIVLKRVRSFVKGKTEIKLRKVDLVRVARDMYTMVKPMFSERGMKLEFEPLDEEVWVWGDVVSIQQVLLNFLTNARQAMMKVEGEKRAVIRVFKREDMGVVEVEDSGPGIPEEIKGKIFSPMFTTKKDGTGLGLVTSKRMVERMGGDIYFVSGEGLGAKFAVALPLYSEERDVKNEEE